MHTSETKKLEPRPSDFHTADQSLKLQSLKYRVPLHIQAYSYSNVVHVLQKQENSTNLIERIFTQEVT